MRIVSATARHIRFARLGGSIGAYDDNTGAMVGHVDIIRGFAHYTGATGSAHAGFSAVVRNGLEGLAAGLAEGMRNGRDDRR